MILVPGFGWGPLFFSLTISAEKRGAVKLKIDGTRKNSAGHHNHKRLRQGTI